VILEILHLNVRVQTIVLKVILGYLADCQLMSLTEEILKCGLRYDLGCAHLLNELELLLLF
jgi:hypothetical protein